MFSCDLNLLHLSSSANVFVWMTPKYHHDVNVPCKNSFRSFSCLFVQHKHSRSMRELMLAGEGGPQMYIQSHLIFDLSLLVVCAVALGKSFDFVCLLSLSSKIGILAQLRITL